MFCFAQKPFAFAIGLCLTVLSLVTLISASQYKPLAKDTCLYYILKNYQYGDGKPVDCYHVHVWLDDRNAIQDLTDPVFNTDLKDMFKLQDKNMEYTGPEDLDNGWFKYVAIVRNLMDFADPFECLTGSLFDCVRPSPSV